MKYNKNYLLLILVLLTIILYTFILFYQTKLISNFKNNGNLFCNTSLCNVGNGWESIFFLRRLFRKVNIIVNSSVVQFLQSMPSFVCFLKPLWRVVNQIQDHRDCSWTLFVFCFIQDPIQ